MKNIIQDLVESQSPETVVAKLTEANEELKAQDAIKGVMFKLLKALSPVFEKAKKLGIVNSYKLSIEPYNSAYLLKTNAKLSHNRDLLKSAEHINNIFYGFYQIYYYPESYFQQYLDDGEKKSAKLTGQGIQLSKEDRAYYSDFVDNKNDIKKAVDNYYKENLAKINIINGLLDTI